MERAIRLDPNFATAYNVLSMVHGNLGQDQLAKPLSAKAMELRSNASELERLYIEGNAFIIRNNKRKARDAFEELVRRFPHAPGSYNNLGLTYTRLGENEKAAAAYQESLRLDPTNLVLQSNLMEAYTDLGGSPRPR